MKILITGGNGFIGHHVVEEIIKNTNFDIDIIDRMNYASFGYSRLRDINCYDSKRIRHFCHDLIRPITEGLAQELGNPDFILHMAAETHVDKSITEPRQFVKANVLGTTTILEFARLAKPKKVIYFSTDEVFGPAPEGVFYKEWDRYKSSNPYAASKAGGEELCVAWHNTYKVPVMITHCMNVFGERQFHEKFIPSTIKKVVNGDKVIIHSDASCRIPGSRFYIHARNVASAMLFLLDNGYSGDKYNIVGEKEVNNLELAQFIAKVVGKPLNYELVDFHSSRPGHDLRYALDGRKLKTMGFNYSKTFEQSLKKTIKWTLEHPKWLEG